MVASAQSPADVVNIALGRIGYQKRIGSLLDGSTAAQAALNCYAQTRDELLRQNDWYFAQETANLTLLKSAPPNYVLPWTNAYPQPPWKFEYEYPDDCLKVRNVKVAPIFLVDPAPQPNNWREAHDSALNKKVILTNVQNALIVYTQRVTNPARWEADFVEALAAALGRRLKPVLIDGNIQIQAQDEATSIAIAEKEQG